MRLLEAQVTQHRPPPTPQPSLSAAGDYHLDVENFLCGDLDITLGSTSAIDGFSLVPFSTTQVQDGAWTPNIWDWDMSFPSQTVVAGEADDVIEVPRSRAPPQGPRFSMIHCSCREDHEPKVFYSAGVIGASVSVMPNPTTVLSHQRAMALPDVYANTIRIPQLCVVEAFLANCLVLGITEHTYFDDDSESPFYRAHLDGSADGGEAVVASVQSTFRTIKYDLRPTKLQITTSHHPSVDLFPFPSTRKRLMEVGHEIDVNEFCIDALEGLRCWGGLRVSKGDGAGVGSGAPWDMRSWEATPWFLKKWEYVLGDEEGEVGRASAWWRSMRGED